MTERSARDLWPEDEEEFERELDEIERGALRMAAVITEITAATRAAIDDARNASDVAAAFEDPRRTLEILAKLAAAMGEVVDALRALLESDPGRMDLPVEWHALLAPSSTDDELKAAAAEYAARESLEQVLYKRYQLNAAAIDDAIGSTAAGTGTTRRHVIRDAIAQAALVAATEARAPVASVVLKVDGQRRRYVRGKAGEDLVPWRDLPPRLLRSWIQRQMRLYLLDLWIPSWRDRERMKEQHGLTTVSLDDVSEVPEPRALALRTDAAEILAELKKFIDPITLELARLRADGLTHSEAAARLQISADDARQRASRLARRLRASHPPGNK